MKQSEIWFLMQNIITFLGIVNLIIYLSIIIIPLIIDNIKEKYKKKDLGGNENERS